MMMPDKVLKTKRAMLICLVFAASFISSSGSSAKAAGSSVCERYMMRYSQQYDVPVGILYAVGLTETGRKGSLHPYALNVDGRSIYARSAADAMRHFRRAKRNGGQMIDVGCMQINHYWHHKQFVSLSDMVDPEQNVAYAAQFLKRLKAREKTWTMAVARYHAGPTKNAAQKRYVCTVIRNMVATGFARWTGPAKRFCR